MEGHINQLVKRALGKGISLFKVLRAASKNPVEHYGLEVGLLREGDLADFIVIDDLDNFKILKTYINGIPVAEAGSSKIKSIDTSIVNHFKTGIKSPEDFRIECKGERIKVISVLDNQLVTKQFVRRAKCENGILVTDLENDLLKIAVVNRYDDDAPSIAMVNNFGLKEGAIASSVAHDSHNIIAVGVDDESISKAINLIIEEKGGISAVNRNGSMVLPLPVAGLMSPKDGYQVAEKYSEMDRIAKEMGSKLTSPYMTLSFMALLVIPSLKLSDKGLFDGDKFEFTSLFV